MATPQFIVDLVSMSGNEILDRNELLIQEINTQPYALYGLTEDEIKIVEGG